LSYRRGNVNTRCKVLCLFVLQLDEDVRVLLQRFDAEGADEAEQKSQIYLVRSYWFIANGSMTV